jgi:O-antigen/teichoic acid export membrane protein
MLKKILSSYLFLILSTFIAKGFILLLNILVARYTTKDTYGIFVLIRSTVNLFETTLSSAVNPFVVNKSSESNSDNTEIFSFGLFYMITALLISSSFLLLGFIVNNFYLGAWTFYFSGEILSSVVFLIITTLFNGFLISLFIGKRLNFLVFLSALISLMIVLLLLYFNYNNLTETIALIFMFIYQLLDVSFKLVYILKFHNKKISVIKLHETLKRVGKIFQTVKPVILGSAINALAFWFVRFIAASSEGGLAVLAEFDVSFQLFILCSIIFNVLFNVVLTKLTKLSEVGGTAIDLLRYSMKFVLISLAIIITPVYFLFDTFILMFGSSYDSNLFPQIALICVFYSISLAFNRVMIILEKSYVLFYVALFSSMAMSLYILIINTTAESLTFSFSVYYFSSCVIYIYILMKEGVFND